MRAATSGARTLDLGVEHRKAVPTRRQRGLVLAGMSASVLPLNMSLNASADQRLTALRTLVLGGPARWVAVAEQVIYVY
jgi:hypothetical protein